MFDHVLFLCLGFVVSFEWGQANNNEWEYVFKKGPSKII